MTAKSPSIKLQIALMHHFRDAIDAIAQRSDTFDQNCAVDSYDNQLTIFGPTSVLTETEDKEDIANLIIEADNEKGFTDFAFVTDTKPDTYEPLVIEGLSINFDSVSQITYQDLVNAIRLFAWHMEGFCKEEVGFEGIKTLFLNSLVPEDEQEQYKEDKEMLFLRRLERSLR
ncbi:MAG: hypothetical protein ACRBCT_03595 [Alphaproteobacteria bacterium]